jgi:hypothetical protein
MKNLWAASRGKAVVCLLPMLGLAACSGEPSGSDIQKAMQAKIDATDFAAVITNVDKYQCIDVNEGRFRCTAKVSRTEGRNSTREKSAEQSLLMEKMGDGWRVVED